MSRYRITESVGHRVENVATFRHLEKHHPSAGHERGRHYETIDGELEEVKRTSEGRTLVKKDFILSHDGAGPVNVPAPVAGYVHHLNDRTNAVRIYDRPFGEPGAQLLAQSLHMARGTSPPEGSRIEYGQPMGRMSDTGSRGSIHAHVEVEAAQFQRYIQDISSGAITPERYPAPGVPEQFISGPVATPPPMADGVLRQGERGAEVAQLQRQLDALGFRDAQGRRLSTDGDFGLNTRQAVEALQRARGMEPDGVVGPDTFAAFQRGQQPVPPAAGENRLASGSAAATPQQAAPPPAGHYGPTPLSNLIGSGEGGYNSFNRGRAGDSVNAAPLDLTGMTVGEIMRRQALPRNDPDRLFAVGKFQMIPGTMEETVTALGIDRNQRFTPELQERMFSDYLVDEKRPAVRAYITGASSGEAGLARAQLALAQEFASVANPRTGRSHYDGDRAGNSASITAAHAASALDQMRAQYRQNIARGLSPADAYRSLGDAAPAPAPDQPTSGREARSSDHGMLSRGDSGPDSPAAAQRPDRLDHRHAQGQPSDALDKAERIPLLSDAAHPDNAMYRQALEGLVRLDRRCAGFRDDRDMANAAASLVFEARVSGLEQIDYVILSRDGEGLFAVQGRPDDPACRRLHVDLAQAIAQPVSQSTMQLAEEVQAPLPVRQEQEQRHAMAVR